MSNSDWAAPCVLCGYNGPGFFQTEQHPCAKHGSERSALLAEIEKLKSRHEGSVDWYQQRFNRLHRWVKEEVEPLSEGVACRYFAICANGSPSPHESADWQETMHGISLERDRLKLDVGRLTTLVNELSAEVDRLRLVEQTCGDLCDKCGWGGIRGGEPCAYCKVDRLNQKTGFIADELDEMVAQMNTPAGRAASRSLFSASGEHLGKAALLAQDLPKEDGQNKDTYKRPSDELATELLDICQQLADSWLKEHGFYHNPELDRLAYRALQVTRHTTQP